MKVTYKTSNALKLLILATLFLQQTTCILLPADEPSSTAKPAAKEKKGKRTSQYQKVVSISEETEKIGVRMVEDENEDVTNQTFIGPIIYETFHKMGTKHTRCGMCHFDIEKGTLQDYIETETDRINPFTGEPFERIESICTTCHRKLHLAHPVGIVPDPAKVVLPPESKGFRGEEDRLSCLSCHNHHPINKNYKYLRWPTDGGENKAKFCAHCHPEKNTPGRIFDEDEFSERFSIAEKIRKKNEPMPKRNPYFKLPDYEIKQLKNGYQGATYNLNNYNEAYHTKKGLTDEEWSKTRAEELYLSGREKLGEGLIIEAIQDLELAKLSSDDINQTNELILLALGMAYRRNSQSEKAKKAFQKALLIKPSLPEANFEIAQIYRLEGKPDDAIYHFLIATRLKPNYPEAYLNLGRIYRGNQAVESARVMFEKTIRLKPDSAEAYIETGKLEYDEANNSEALKNFRRALQIKPHSSDALTGMGECLLLEKDYQAAVENFKKALSLKQTALVYLGLGRTYLLLNETGNAQDALIKASELDEKDPAIWYNLGLAYAALELQEQSYQAFLEAVRSDEDYAEAWYEIGRMYLRQMKYQESEEALKYALEIRPDYAQAYVELGRCYYQSQKLPLAITAYQKAIGLHPDYSDILNDLEKTLIAQCDKNTPQCDRLGDFYLSQKRFDMAINPYLKAIKGAPKNAQSYRGLGIIYTKLKRYNEALSHLRRARDITPDSPEVHYYLGMALKSMGKDMEWGNELSQAVVLKYIEDNPGKSKLEASEALRYNKILLYQTTVRIDKENPEIHNNLGTAYMIEGKLSEAISEYERALELRPEYPDYLYNIGLAAGSNRDYKKAQDSYLALLGIVPDHFQARYNLGEIYIKQGMLDQAIDQYRQILPLRPQLINISLGHLYRMKWEREPKRKWLIQAQSHFKSTGALNNVETQKNLAFVENLLQGKIQALIVRSKSYERIKKIARQIKKQIGTDTLKAITRQYSEEVEFTFAEEKGLGKKLWRDLNNLKNGELSPIIFHQNRYFLFYRINVPPEKSI